MLEKAGNSNTAERVVLLERFLAPFGAHRIATLLADREFVGEDWFTWLQHQGIPFHLRIKCDTHIPNAWNKFMRADRLFESLAPNQVYICQGAG